MAEPDRNDADVIGRLLVRVYEIHRASYRQRRRRAGGHLQCCLAARSCDSIFATFGEVERYPTDFDRAMALFHSLLKSHPGVGVMSTKVQNYLEEKITWKPGPDPLYPYGAEYNGAQCLIRVNDFPDDHLYTLMVDGREVAHFDNWPPCWTRP